MNGELPSEPTASIPRIQGDQLGPSYRTDQFLGLFGNTQTAVDMAGFMVGDFSFKGGADIFYFQDIDQVLGELVDPETQFLRPPPPLGLISKKFRIVNLDHAYTGAGGTDYPFVILEDLDKMFGRFFRLLTISGVDSRLTAAGLFPMVDRIDPEPTQ